MKGRQQWRVKVIEAEKAGNAGPKSAKTREREN